MANIELLKAMNDDKLCSLGFVKDDDELPDHHMMTSNFHLIVDITYDVKLARRNPDTDFIELKCDSESDLRNIIAFIED